FFRDAESGGDALALRRARRVASGGHRFEHLAVQARAALEIVEREAALRQPCRHALHLVHDRLGFSPNQTIARVPPSRARKKTFRFLYARERVSCWTGGGSYRRPFSRRHIMKRMRWLMMPCVLLLAGSLVQGGGEKKPKLDGTWVAELDGKK